ncbi:MAG: GNAT family N-acetyltransferase [Pseudomonadota bacterium]
MEVRDYIPADRAALIAICAEMEAHYDGAEAIGPEEVAEQVDHAMAHLRDTTLLVAPVEGGTLAGFLTAVRTWPGTRMRFAWWVKEVYVAKAARGKGVGTALMQAFLARARMTDGERVDIATDRTNTAAIGLYESLGGCMTDKVLLRYQAAS